MGWFDSSESVCAPECKRSTLFFSAANGTNSISDRWANLYYEKNWKRFINRALNVFEWGEGAYNTSKQATSHATSQYIVIHCACTASFGGCVFRFYCTQCNKQTRIDTFAYFIRSNIFQCDCAAWWRSRSLHTFCISVCFTQHAAHILCASNAFLSYVGIELK